MSGFVADSVYTWTFIADSGDWYAGVLFHDTGVYLPGQYLDVPLGFYFINDRIDYGFDLGAFYGIAEGTTYTTTYFDAVQGYLQPYNYAYLAAPSSYLGLGSEYDFAWNGAFWDDFGYGGVYQAGYFG